ncbi:MAG: OmpA family protein [Endomicrobiales bacterium]|nr:OmpA family protein [Endomicrobiales bacterium]
MKIEKTNFKHFCSACAALLILTLIAATSFAAFQESGWGARPMGLGGAFTAIDEDVDGMLYNPSLLAGLQDPELTFMYGKLYTGLDEVNMGLSYFAFGMPLKNKDNTIGFSWTNFVSADLYDESSFAFNYSRVIGAGFSGGVNLKYLSHKYTLDNRTINDPVFASGNSKGALTLDLGTLYRPEILNENLALGLSLKNITQPDLGLKSKDIVPAELRLGGAYNFTEDILAALDFSYRMQDWGSASDKYNVHLGGEFWFIEHLLALRAGANTTEVAIGFGINPTLNNLDLQLDYGFIMPLLIKESMGTHRISLTLRFLDPNYVAEEKKYVQEVKHQQPKVVVEEEEIASKVEPKPESKIKQVMPETMPQIQSVAPVPVSQVKLTPVVVPEPKAQEPLVIFAEAQKQGMNVKAEGEKIIITENINFESGKSQVLPSEKQKISRVVKLMNNYTDYNVTIMGHTDSSGGVKANLDLSELRAQSVLEQMVSMGISEDRLSSIGMGGSTPIADNTTVEGKAKNRRVEFVLEK